VVVFFKVKCGFGADLFINLRGGREMQDLNKLIAKAKSNLAEANEAKDKLSHLEIELEANNRRIRSLIENGNSSGDKIIDLVMLRHYAFDERLVYRYRELENRLKDKIGQDVLVIKEADYCYVHGASYSPNHYGLKKMIMIGKLSGENFIFSERGFSGRDYFFPVDAYFRYWKGVLVLINSPIDLVDLSGGNSLSGQKPMEPIVLIGEEDINNWLNEAKDKSVSEVVIDAIKKLNNTSSLSIEQDKKSKKAFKQKPFISVEKIDKRN
jgi:hypothetical protein